MSALSVPKRVGKYLIGDLIGRGSFATVFLACDLETSTKVACKVIVKDLLKHHDLFQRFEQEIRILQQINHASVTKLYDILQDDKHFYVFIEYCPNGELFKYIIENKKLGEENAKVLFKEIVAGLAYVHSLGIAHRDLKPENILLSETNHIKITDFGLSRFVPANGLVKTSCGSPCYASPECISGEEYDGIKSDMWSLGVILFAMVTGLLPWTKRNKAALFKQIQAAKYRMPQNITPECQDLISKLLTPNPKIRLSASQVFTHPWLQTTPYSPIAIDCDSYVSIKKIDQFFNIDQNDNSDDILDINLTTARSVDFKTVYAYLHDSEKYNQSKVAIVTSSSVINQRKSMPSKKIVIPMKFKSTLKPKSVIKKGIPRKL